MEKQINDLMDNQELFRTLALKFQKEQIKAIKEMWEPDTILEGMLESIEKDFRYDLKNVEERYKTICKVIIEKSKKRKQQNCSQEI
jgi:hypothetical protein